MVAGMVACPMYEVMGSPARIHSVVYTDMGRTLPPEQVLHLPTLIAQTQHNPLSRTMSNPITTWIKDHMETYHAREAWMEDRVSG